jgi:voltage-gated potassium channel
MSNNLQNRIGFLDLLIFVLSLYVLIALLIDTFIMLPTEISKVLMSIDNGICIVFLIDFFVRFFQAENKLKYMKWGWIDLISSIPYIAVLRVGRLFRLIKLFRILRAFRSTKVLIHSVFKNKIEGTMTLASVISALIIIFSSISILIVENAPESNIKSAEDAIWWTMETITTVGYGDKFPVTSEGRMIGIIVMIVGVGIFGTFTGYIANLFTQESKKNLN